MPSSGFPKLFGFILLFGLLKGCSFDLYETYDNKMNFKNQSQEALTLTYLVQRGDSDHACRPDSAKQVHAVEAASEQNIVVSVDCRMPPERVAEVEKETKFQIGTAELELPINAETLQGATLEAYSENPDATPQLFQISNAERSVTAKEYYEWPKMNLGNAWVQQRQNGKIFLQLAFEDNLLSPAEVNENKPLRVRLAQLQTEDLETRQEADFADIPLQLTNRQKLVVSVGYRNSSVLVCNSERCRICSKACELETPKIQ